MADAAPKFYAKVDLFLGLVISVASIIAVIGNSLAIMLMGYLTLSGRAKFTTLIYLNIAIINFVVGSTSWIVIGPALLSQNRTIPTWYMSESTVSNICKYFVVNTEKICPAIVLYSITYMAMAKVLLYSNPLRYPNRHYLLSFRTTLIVLLHFWVATIVFCLYPVVRGGSHFEQKVAKCIYSGMSKGDQRQVTWLSLYNFIFVIIPLLVLILVSLLLINQLYLLTQEHNRLLRDAQLNVPQVSIELRSRKEMSRAILFAINCLVCYSGIMFVALHEFVDLIKNTQASSVTQNFPYAIVIGLGIMFSINAAINPWIYLIKNDSFTLLRAYISDVVAQKIEKVTKRSPNCGNDNQRKQTEV